MILPFFRSQIHTQNLGSYNILVTFILVRHAICHFNNLIIDFFSTKVTKEMEIDKQT